jgi:hypothetical protein
MRHEIIRQDQVVVPALPGFRTVSFYLPEGVTLANAKPLDLIRADDTIIAWIIQPKIQRGVDRSQEPEVISPDVWPVLIEGHAADDAYIFDPVLDCWCAPMDVILGSEEQARRHWLERAKRREEAFLAVKSKATGI